jgi:hypothetical protein
MVSRSSERSRKNELARRFGFTPSVVSSSFPLGFRVEKTINAAVKMMMPVLILLKVGGGDGGRDELLCGFSCWLLISDQT